MLAPTPSVVEEPNATMVSSPLAMAAATRERKIRDGAGGLGMRILRLFDKRMLSGTLVHKSMGAKVLAMPSYSGEGAAPNPCQSAGRYRLHSNIMCRVLGAPPPAAITRAAVADSDRDSVLTGASHRRPE